MLGRLLSLMTLSFVCVAQPPVNISVNLAESRGAWNPAWSFFGYDEPNYTYTANGKKLLGELAHTSATPVYVRMHNLLSTGDGTSALKWGSTNAYTEDSEGRPVYDWKILDRISDTFHELGIKPLVEIGFMPRALSIKPDPYQHTFPNGAIWSGWAYPPKDYGKWSELVYQWVRHDVDRYGAQEVASWYWEVWNEPNIGYWQSTPEEYYKLYDYTADALKRAFPQARVGGPHSTGPGSAKSSEFLRAFLEHVVRGKNFATGKIGSPIDYVGFHAKGSPQMIDGHVQMGIRSQARSVSSGFEIAAAFPELRDKPIVIGESDPEGCGACTAKTNPQNGYRNGPLYASYNASMFADTLALADRHRVKLLGAVTWAFEFENQPWFEGFRTLATNGVDKAVLNVFRMFGLLGGERVQATSDAAAGLDDVLASGVRGNPDINALATRQGSRAAVMVWNYHDDDVAAPASRVTVHIVGIPNNVRSVSVRHYRIDQDHSNAFAVWKKMGSPQNPTAEQFRELEAAGQLALLESPRWFKKDGATLDIETQLPRQAVSLLELTW